MSMGDKKLTPEEIARRDALKTVTPAAVQAHNDAVGTATLDNAVAAAQGAATNTEVTPVGNVGGSAGDVDAAEKEATVVATKGNAADGTSVGSVKTGADFMSKYIDDLGYTEEQKRADERRRKAAQWVTVAQMLGDSLGALGNVINVGHGAVSQTMEPGALKAGAATYQLDQDIRAAQEKARKAQYDAILKKYEMEWEKEKADRAQANADRAYELQLKNFNADEAWRAQQQKNYEAETSTKNEQWQKEYELRKNTVTAELNKMERENKPFRFNAGNEYVDIPREYINEQSVGAIFQMLPDDIKAKAGSPRYGKDMLGNNIIVGYNNPDLKDMLAAIGMGIGGENVAKAIKDLAKGKVTSTTTPATKKKVWENE